MSNTRHNLPTHTHHHMRVQNRRKAEASALEDIKEAGVISRHMNRLQSYWSQIPEPWDDKCNASWREYHNKNYWKNKRLQESAPRYDKRLLTQQYLNTKENDFDDTLYIIFSDNDNECENFLKH